MQSVRVGRNGCFADPKVRKWKASILPYIEKACTGRRPTELPLMVKRLRYIFAYPKHTPAGVKYIIDHGGTVPYLGPCDITDNLAKGLIDTCASHVFVNDKQIWMTCDIEKVYGKEDAMYIEFEETPDILTITGVLGDGSPPTDDSIL